MAYLAAGDGRLVHDLNIYLALWLIFIFDRSTLRKRLPDLVISGQTAFIISQPVNLFSAIIQPNITLLFRRQRYLEDWFEQEVIKSDQPVARIIARQITDTALALEDLRYYLFDVYDNYALGCPNTKLLRTRSLPDRHTSPIRTQSRFGGRRSSVPNI